MIPPPAPPINHSSNPSTPMDATERDSGGSVYPLGVDGAHRDGHGGGGVSRRGDGSPLNLCCISGGTTPLPPYFSVASVSLLHSPGVRGAVERALEGVEADDERRRSARVFRLAQELKALPELDGADA